MILGALDTEKLKSFVLCGFGFYLVLMISFFLLFAVIGFFLRFEDDSIESAKTVKQWNVKIISVRILTHFLSIVNV